MAVPATAAHPGPPHRTRPGGAGTREVILRVADQAFSAEVTPPPLQEIARRAGVGRATVYRYFPHRHALADALARRAVQRLERALASDPAPPLREVLRETMLASVSRRSLFCLLRQMPEGDQRRYARLLLTALEPAFRSAQQAGLLRADVEPEVVLVVLDMLAALPVTAQHDATAGAVVDVLLDGLFHPTNTS